MGSRAGTGHQISSKASTVSSTLTQTMQPAHYPPTNSLAAALQPTEVAANSTETSQDQEQSESEVLRHRGGCIDLSCCDVRLLTTEP